MEETIIHALWLCPIPQDIYYQYFKKIQKSSLSTMTLLKLLEEMSTILYDTDLAKEVVVVAFRVWKCRKLSFKKKFKHPGGAAIFG